MLMAKKEIITLVGKSYAYNGFKFYFSGPRLDICPKTCRFINPCMMNLQPDTIYTVIENQNIEHMCPMDYHRESMVLVKVTESDLKILMETKSVFLGATTSYNPVNCNIPDCPCRQFCLPIKGLNPGTKLKIIEIVQKISDVKCNRNLSLVKVEKA